MTKCLRSLQSLVFFLLSQAMLLAMNQAIHWVIRGFIPKRSFLVAFNRIFHCLTKIIILSVWATSNQSLSLTIKSLNRHLLVLINGPLIGSLFQNLFFYILWIFGRRDMMMRILLKFGPWNWFHLWSLFSIKSSYAQAATN
mgnify:CR=1 FL=1